jgi:hypothetical protein
MTLTAVWTPNCSGDTVRGPDIFDRLIGPEATTVKLTVLRPGQRCAVDLFDRPAADPPVLRRCAREAEWRRRLHLVSSGALERRG